MTTFNVIHIGSQREVKVGTVDAMDAEDAQAKAFEKFGDEDDKDRGYNNYRVESQSVGDTTCYNVFFGARKMEYRVWADTKELAQAMAVRDYKHLYSAKKITVG